MRKVYFLVFYDVYSRIISRLCEDVIHYLCRSNYTSHYA